MQKNHDSSHTLRYLTALYGPGAENRVLRWRTISRQHRGGAQLLTGSYADLNPQLSAANYAGDGVFLQVNHATGATDRDVTRVVASFTDCDVGDLPTVYPDTALAPSLLVNSGNGQHGYWVLTDGTDRDAWIRGQKALARAMGTDPKIHNLSRVMRVPGWLWTKPDSMADWAMVTCSLSTTPLGERPLDSLIGGLTLPPADGATESWALYRLGCGVAIIRGAERGKSQNTFNRVAFEIKDYVRAGLLGEEHARSVLGRAGEARGVDGIGPTLDSAFSASGGALLSGVRSEGTGVILFPSNHEEDIASTLALAWGGPTKVAAAQGSCYVYNDATGVWDVLSGERLRSKVAAYHLAPYSKGDGTTGRVLMGISLRTRVAQAILEHPAIFVPSLADWLDSAPPGVAFANGYLGLDGVLREHAPGNLAFNAFAWDYRPEMATRAPRWFRFLREVWADCSEEEIELRTAFLGAWYGSAILGRAPRWSKVVLAVGDGNNGKSILLSTLADLLPHNWVASVPPQLWRDPYYRAGFAPPVILNAVAEIPEGEWMGAEWFKSIVGGDKVSARLPYELPQTIKPRAAHFFAMNELPGSTDRSVGFWRRTQVLPFSVAFTGREEDPRTLRGALLAEREAIIAWALQWAFTAESMGSLPPVDTNGAQEEWAEENDPTAQWLHERVTTGGDVWTRAGELYADFGVWMSMNGFGVRTSTWWGRQMRRLKIEKRREAKSYFYLAKLYPRGVK